MRLRRTTDREQQRAAARDRWNDAAEVLVRLEALGAEDAEAREEELRDHGGEEQPRRARHRRSRRHAPHVTLSGTVRSPGDPSGWTGGEIASAVARSEQPFRLVRRRSSRQGGGSTGRHPLACEDRDAVVRLRSAGSRLRRRCRCARGPRDASTAAADRRRARPAGSRDRARSAPRTRREHAAMRASARSADASAGATPAGSAAAVSTDPAVVGSGRRSSRSPASPSTP